ncbi:PREDICTED: stromal membrane-associated protein 1-like isoform X2 [Priapulus caudatus]|uniref:Stromal membrane-associated protein 1-like isoform X2 n=1 Tax=Priapulus caudatus TaxID=37621 RepID=A0ABM1EQV2_PRICU|nr:PREDICTED: stromal membrane-associated protein 1-like isoform X2 [Priapulus caudatus]
MSSQKEVYRQKQLQEKFQAILNGLLRDEDNKYCVDCDAKGPRWASWNIGIFLCIRCAGIHRNLGTHISKVKSVNLDTWSPDQVESMTEMGNSRARAVYEANLPDGFRRPQTDSSSLEAFIRQKYEQKRYIAKEWVPPARPTGKAILLASEDADKKKPRSRPTPKVASEPYLPSLVAKSRQRASSSDNESLKMPTAASVNKENNSADLLGLDDPSPKLDNSDDLFGGFLGAPAIAEVQNNTLTNTSALDKPKASSHNDLESLFGSEGQQVVQQNIDKSQSTKDSILSLYGNNSYTQPQTYGVPGSFYPGQQQPVASFTDFAGMTAQPPSNSHFPTDPQVALGGMYVSPQQMAVGYPNGAPQMAPAPQANMGMQGVMGQQMAMGGVAPSMYGNQFQQQQQQQQHQQQQQQQQQHLQQVQQQLAGIKMANPNVEANIMNNAPQWNAMPSGGQTLSTNLWQ